ncbi:MAG: twin-arginine translocation signal domain-containing protein, partial [Burkholderiaceae bacterium]
MQRRSFITKATAGAAVAAIAAPSVVHSQAQVRWRLAS